MPEIENFHTVRVTEIVSLAYAFGGILLTTNVVTRPPSSRSPFETPVTEVRALFERLPIRFSTGP